MKTILIYLYLFLFPLIVVYQSGYRLVWSDEFNGVSIDKGKYGYDIGHGQGYNEFEYYTSRWENEYVSEGFHYIVK